MSLHVRSYSRGLALSSGSAGQRTARTGTAAALAPSSVHHRALSACVYTSHETTRGRTHTIPRGDRMPSRVKVERLSMARYVTIVLRIVVDRQGQLEHGEVAGVELLDAPRRFRGWRGLSRAVRALLAAPRPDDEDGGESEAGGM